MALFVDFVQKQWLSFKRARFLGGNTCEDRTIGRTGIGTGNCKQCVNFWPISVRIEFDLRVGSWPYWILSLLSPIESADRQLDCIVPIYRIRGDISWLESILSGQGEAPVHRTANQPAVTIGSGSERSWEGEKSPDRSSDHSFAWYRKSHLDELYRFAETKARIFYCIRSSSQSSVARLLFLWMLLCFWPMGHCKAINASSSSSHTMSWLRTNEIFICLLV